VVRASGAPGFCALAPGAGARVFVALKLPVTTPCAHSAAAGSALFRRGILASFARVRGDKALG